MNAPSNLQLSIEELENLDTPDDTPWYIRVGDVIIIAGIVVGIAAT
ncbi:daptide-type RiPP [Arthrobacter sp. efr-133-TYG-104]|nr:daptide-type RiPP [Arthrobacter sp. efr-133-TYG-104]